MIVMPANVTSPEVRGLLHEFPLHIGNLFSPDAWQTPIGRYALDNGRFSAGDDWSVHDYFDLLDRARAWHRPPDWALAPDHVGNWDLTRREWDYWRPIIAGERWPVALAVQDGATVAEVEAMGPHVVFVGGSTQWKWRTVEMWAREFPRVHVGRVNSMRKAWDCFGMGVESIDGTGWMRTTRQRKQLRTLLGQMAGKRESQIPLIPYQRHAALAAAESQK